MFREANVVLHGLMTNMGYAEAVLPYLEDQFFDSAKSIFKAVRSHITRYNASPTYEQVVMAISETNGDSDETLARLQEVIKTDEAPDPQWLLDQTETFIRIKRRHHFLLDCINLTDNGKPLPSPEEYTRALNFCLSGSAKHGFNLFDDCGLLHQHMTDTNERFPFDIDELNRLTNGGVIRKTLNVILAPTNVGKSLMLCHLAASYMRQGRNVLYVTLEMSDKTTAQRIVANLLDLDMNSLSKMPLAEFQSGLAAVRGRCGELFIREFPSLSVTTANVRSLLADLKRSEDFVPDVVMVDYLNLCRAATLGKSAKADMYQAVGTVAAELHGFATEHDVVVWTATQTNRSGFKSAELSLEHTSESYAINSHADLILGLSCDEKLPGTRIVQRLKNRNDGISGSPKAVVGADSSRMKMYDLNSAEQVKTALAAIPTAKRRAIAAKMKAKTPQFAIDEESMASAV